MKAKIPVSALEKKKQQILESLWLHYYNSVLLEKGRITEDEYHRMKLKIIHRTETVGH